MDPVQAVVTALVAGATAMLESTVSEVVKDAYAQLKKVIQRKYPSVDVGALEKKPDSESRQGVAAEELTDANAVNDSELLLQAQHLLSTVKQQPSLITGTLLRDVEIAEGSIKIADIDVDSHGKANVVGAHLENIKAPGGSIDISGINVRHNDSPDADDGNNPPPVIKILFLAANPLDTPDLRVDEESRAIKDVLRKSDYRTQFDIELELAVRIGDLQELLLRHRPDIVHFSGHGTTQSLILQDANGKHSEVSGKAIAQLFSILEDETRCVVLNACYTDVQARAIAQHVDFVIGISDKITDGASRQFASSFYQALGYARTMGEAYKLGCHQIELHGFGEAHKPIFHHRRDPSSARLIDPKSTDPKA